MLSAYSDNSAVMEGSRASRFFPDPASRVYGATSEAVHVDSAGNRDIADTVMDGIPVDKAVTGHIVRRSHRRVEKISAGHYDADIGNVVQTVDAGRRMPGGARGQLVALQQHHVGPAELGQVVEDAAADQPAADHHCLCVRLHGVSAVVGGRGHHAGPARYGA